MNNIKVKIIENKVVGEVYSWHLYVQRGEGAWWGIEIATLDEMRKIAEVLTEKAHQIGLEKMMNEPNQFCEDCGAVLYDLNTVKIELNPVDIDSDPEIIYICSDCDGVE